MTSGETKPTVADIYRRLAQSICELSEEREALQQRNIVLVRERDAQYIETGRLEDIIDKLNIEIERLKEFEFMYKGLEK